MSALASTPPAVSSISPHTSPGLEAPRGGILLNGDSPRRPSISLPAESPALGTSASGTSFLSRLSPSSLGGAGTSLASGGPVPSINVTQASGSTPASKTAVSTSPSAGQTRIRFAPLPEPQRPRSLSTGRNIGWSTAEDAEGNEYRKMEMRNVPVQDGEYDEAVDDEEEDEDDDDERNHSDGGSKSRRWSKGMSSSWKVSKKILTVGLLDDSKDKEKEKETAYGGGMPLKKSVSTGGMIGSSPFRWTSIEERKRSMQGLAPEPSNHRRQSSVEITGSSPQPVKLLNGRVYGARRASEIAEMQKKRREAAEPAFVEWGNAKPETTTVAPSGGRSLLGDTDEGSGMEWVKRRRAEREQAKAKKEAEEKEKAARTAAGPEDGLAPDEIPPLSASSPYSSENERIEVVTPAQTTSELPTTPIIHVSEHSSHPHALAPPGDKHDMGGGETRAIQIKPGQQRVERDTFDDESSEEEDEEEDPDKDDSEDEVPMPRTTSSAAGIEVVSRHHH